MVKQTIDVSGRTFFSSEKMCPKIQKTAGIMDPVLKKITEKAEKSSSGSYLII